MLTPERLSENTKQEIDQYLLVSEQAISLEESKSNFGSAAKEWEFLTVAKRGPLGFLTEQRLTESMAKECSEK
jgi:hypothetical protein